MAKILIAFFSRADATVLDGLAIRGNDCQNDQDSVRNKVSDWILELKQ